jgi:putative SOS response-associated peptidase YedK
MCDRFSLQHEEAELVQRFQIQQQLFRPGLRYNIAPTQQIAVVTESGERTLEGMKWGLVPYFIQANVRGLFTARAETLMEKPSFRPALIHRRCLIPASGFYAWKKEWDQKEPMYIRRKDAGLLAFAGLWEETGGADGSPLRTCAIITVPPNGLMAAIHNRLPAILPSEREALWVDSSVTDPAIVLALLQPLPNDEFRSLPGVHPSE